MVYIADDQPCHFGDMGRLFAIAIEEYCHREGWHHRLFHFLVGLLACDGLGQVSIKLRLVLDVRIVLKKPEYLLQSYGTAFVGLHIPKDTYFDVIKINK